MLRCSLKTTEILILLTKRLAASVVGKNVSVIITHFTVLGD